MNPLKVPPDELVDSCEDVLESMLRTREALDVRIREQRDALRRARDERDAGLPYRERQCSHHPEPCQGHLDAQTGIHFDHVAVHRSKR